MKNSFYKGTLMSYFFLKKVNINNNNNNGNNNINNNINNYY